MQNQKSEIITIRNVSNNDFVIEVNKENLANEGHQLIGLLLHALQVYKSLGAIDKARELYQKYSSVPPEYISHYSKILKSRLKY